MTSPESPRVLSAGGRLAYVAKMFPRISETFVLNEIRALRCEGVPFRIYSILPPSRDRRIHPEAESLAAETEILPQASWRGLPEFFAATRRCFRAAPLETAAEAARALLRPTPRSFRTLFRAVVLAERLRRDEISHIHAAWAHTPASVAEIASRLTRIPWSMAAHAKDIHTSDELSLARKMSSARFTIACTRHHRDLLERIAARQSSRFPPGQVHLAYHGVDTDYFSPAPADEEAGDGIGRRGENTDTPAILFVGRLVLKKGPELLVDAAALLRKRGLPFTIEMVGDGPLRAPLERYIRDLGLEDVVFLRGLFVREEIRDVMRRATCFALPCRVTSHGDRDGIPNSLGEAMASGLAVVSTRLPSIQELVEDGETGLLVPPEDPAALAEALARLLGDPVERRRLGRRARAAVVERFGAIHCEPERVRHLACGLEIGRVLYVSGDRGVPVRGQKGASIHVRSLIEAWRESGVESRVVTTNAGPSQGEAPAADVREARAGVLLTGLAKSLARILGSGAALERALLRIADNLALLRAARTCARSWRPDIVYERYALSSVAGSLLARWLGIPHVLEVNAPLADEEDRFRGLRLPRLTRLLERWVMRRADLVGVVSPPLEEHARRQGVPPERIRVLPNGVDTRRFGPGRDRERIRARLGLDGAFVAGFAGTLRPWHGVAHLIRGFASAASTHANMKLMIMGDGPERAALESLAREVGVADRVAFLGAVPHTEMGDHLAACDVLCAPYGPIEGFYFSPIKIAEYLACGRPVIASAVGHLAETLDESRGAVLTRPGDEDAIGRALVSLARDPKRRESLGAAAASSVWTWSDVARAVLREAAASRARLWAWPTARPFTVGYVVKMFPRFSETFILNEILELERTGTRVVVFSMKEPAESIRQPGVDRVRAPVIVLPERAASRARLAGNHLACLLRSPIRYLRTLAFVRGRGTESALTKFLHAAILARTATSLGVEHLHAHFASGPARQAKFASMLSGIPFSFTAHAKDLYWSGHGHRECHKLKHRIQRASLVVAISEHNRCFMESIGFHVPRGRIATIYNGLDLKAWPLRGPRGRPVVRSEIPLILAVGRLVEKKGFDVLLEAASILVVRGTRFRCWIAGEGPERERLAGLVREKNLEGWVEFLGATPQDRLAADLYSRAHVLAQPSIVASDGDQDGIPTVILEAMSVGLPVVATPVSGIPEAVVDGETGLIAQPGDPRALADALSRVLADDALAARLASGARGMIEKRFSLRENAQHLVRLLRRPAHELGLVGRELTDRDPEPALVESS
ncbi:MAG: glycosyltransferase [Candidatus Eisenbacteria bacterium]|uniref:Glycosyltransferase n=1 Tax=Eiseniibacteriota bacterium TaxID=2212470 RepID=A0A538TBD9_UNCEI|nr:MAG: glycosyltransferase [Candidatus Eisenbacteria bacterium]